MLETMYDELAEGYDGYYNKEEYIKEDKALFTYLDHLILKNGYRSLLDVGCGTGIVLDKVLLNGVDYVGFDPSGKSVELAKAKEPKQGDDGHRLFFTRTWEQFLPRNNKKYDLIVSLYGSPTYTDPEHYEDFISLLNEGGQCICLFYLPYYTPHIYQNEPQKSREVIERASYRHIVGTFPYVRRWAGKYLVASNRPIDELVEPEQVTLTDEDL